MDYLKEAILLSGGVDSICLAYILKPNIAYTIDYGQKVAKREIYVSQLICRELGINHCVIKIDCSSLGSGTLVGKESSKVSPAEEWWPFRNQLLFTLSSMQAIKDEVNKIYIGSVNTDSFHKDGTFEFIKLMNALSEFQEGAIQIEAPLLNYKTHEIIINHKIPRELLLLAHSCHISDIACGHCSGCLKQIRIRQEIGIE